MFFFMLFDNWFFHFLNFSGATLCKCINRAIGTFLAGGLGVGIHLVADKSGDELKPIILGISVFLFGKSRAKKLNSLSES